MFALVKSPMDVSRLMNDHNDVQREAVAGGAARLALPSDILAVFHWVEQQHQPFTCAEVLARFLNFHSTG